MTIAEMVMLGGFALTLIATTVGFTVHISRAINDLNTTWTKRFAQLVEADEEKRARIYERLDEVKNQFDDKYVKREVCDVLSKSIANDLKELKDDIKKLLYRNGIKPSGS